MTSRYAVVGQPVAHSKSPIIHKMFAEQTGQQLDYGREEIQAEDFQQFVKDFFEAGGSGLNITLPHKEAAFSICEELTERAKLAGAVNTLFMRDQKLWGDNTDGAGLLRDISVNHGFALSGKKVLMLGAGGAARGALATLASSGASAITLLNRTLAKAEAIRDALAREFEITVSDYESANQSQGFDLIINATSLSLENQLPPVSAQWLNDGCCCYDMMYSDQATVFQRWAIDNGAAKALDGLGMLVEQAAESFLVWRGVRPDTGPVLEYLRKQN